MSAWDYGGTQAAQIQNNQMTSQAQQQAFEMQKIKAEQDAEAARVRAENLALTAKAYSDLQTADARALAVQYTANAEGTAMMGTAAWQGTATSAQLLSNNIGTQTAFAGTVAVLPTHAIYTQNAVHSEETITAGEAEKVVLAVKRQTMKNVFDAYLPWAMVVGATIVLAVGFNQFVKTRVHTRDEHGAVPLLQVKADNGDTVFVQAENLETGVMKIQKDGAVVRYAPQDAREQSDIKRRNQAVEAIRALPTPYAQTGAKIVTSEFSSTHARVTVGNPSAMSPALDEANQGFLEETKND
jgi:hypothetical protein